MSRTSAKKSPAERRKSPRGSKPRARNLSPAAAPKRKKAAARGGADNYSEIAGKRPVSEITEKKNSAKALAVEDSCIHCSKDLRDSDRALLVEEEKGRVFCSEECISIYFAPEIERLEKQYFRNLTPGDLKSDEREKYGHLRWITLEEPDEVWCEKTLTGDRRYTLISEFKPGNKKIWCVCICLFLRGEPSFLFIAFPTSNTGMVNLYRRGERVEFESARSKAIRTQGEETQSEAEDAESGEDAEPTGAPPTDSLAHEWTDQEVRLASLSQNRKATDIPPEKFEHYQSRLDLTLEAPDELWTIEPPRLAQMDENEAEIVTAAETETESESESESENESDSEPLRIFHFIKYFADESPGFWYVIVARETNKSDEIEILEAFPTRDMEVVETFRRGSAEMAARDGLGPSRLVH